MPPVLGTATGWLHYASLVLLLGAVAARAVVIPRAVRAGAGPGVVSTLRARATRLALAGALLLVVATGLVFLRQLLDFRDPFVPWTEDADLLLNGTTWGTSWMLAAAGSLVAAAAFGAAARGPERRGAWTAGAVLALALGAFPAFTGHASGTGALRPLTLTADTLHVWGAGAWIGALAFVLHAERRWRLDAAPGAARSLLPLLVPAFSPLALASAATVASTGVLAGLVHLGGLAELATTPYGLRLLLKLALVAALAGLGWLNWKRHTPRLGEPAGALALRRTAGLELAVAQLVLIVTAVLVHTPPPGG